MFVAAPSRSQSQRERSAPGFSGGTSLTVLCDGTRRGDDGSADTWEDTDMDADDYGEHRL